MSRDGDECDHKVTSLRKLRLDRGGYANRGRDYYGHGAPVYVGDVDVPDYRFDYNHLEHRYESTPVGCKWEQVEVRAHDRKSAKQKILAEAKRRWPKR